MIYEAQVQYYGVNEKGNEVMERENLIVEDLMTFGDVEELLYLKFQDYKAVDVVSIKRSKVKEIANEKSNIDDMIWMAELQDKFMRDDGKEVEMKYKILFFSETFDTAKSFIGEYSKQGYDMTLVSLKLTNFSDVFNAEMLYELQ